MSRQIRIKPRWMLVDSKGKVLDKFRYKLTAKEALKKFKLHRNDSLHGLKIVPIKNDNK